MEATEEILLRRSGALGHIVLNRPKAVNALNLRMVRRIAQTLATWEMDDDVATVLISGRGDRGLCAGGDIVGIYHDITSGGAGTAAFWAEEYALNAQIANYSKPTVALMDGIVLGGGVGVSAHALIRIVTERSRIGMPETRIGFVPDVGGTYLLSHAAGELGTHLALTGGTADGPDAIAAGLADLYVHSSDLDGLVAALEHSKAGAAAAHFSKRVPESRLAQQRHWIDDCYAPDDVETIVRRLLAKGSADAALAASMIQANSPTAVKVALEALRRARDMQRLEDALRQEYRVSVRFAQGTEFAEGIRAQVIDKDRVPKWSPATLQEVSDEDVRAYFEHPVHAYGPWPMAALKSN